MGDRGWLPPGGHLLAPLPQSRSAPSCVRPGGRRAWLPVGRSAGLRAGTPGGSLSTCSSGCGVRLRVLARSTEQPGVAPRNSRPHSPHGCGLSAGPRGLPWGSRSPGNMAQGHAAHGPARARGSEASTPCRGRQVRRPCASELWVPTCKREGEHNGDNRHCPPGCPALEEMTGK